MLWNAKEQSIASSDNIIGALLLAEYFGPMEPLPARSRDDSGCRQGA
jgi:hypothetical protein